MTHAKVYSGFQARSIQRIDFLTTFTDTSPDGPPGDYTVTYRCQYSYNTIDTNPVGNIIQIPVRPLRPAQGLFFTSSTLPPFAKACAVAGVSMHAGLQQAILLAHLLKHRCIHCVARVLASATAPCGMLLFELRTITAFRTRPCLGMGEHVPTDKKEAASLYFMCNVSGRHSMLATSPGPRARS